MRDDYDTVEEAHEGRTGEVLFTRCKSCGMKPPIGKLVGPLCAQCRGEHGKPSVCFECGARVGDVERHEQWHKNLSAALLRAEG